MKRRTTMKRLALCLCALCLVLTLLTGCGEELTPVYVQSVAEIMGYSNTGAFNVSSGVVMPQEEVKVERDPEREISGLCVEVGQTVNEGDVLFIYKTGNISLQIDKVNLEIEQMKNSISDLKAQITQLEKEKKNAKESEKLAYTLQIQSLQTDQKETEYNLSLKQKELTDLKNNTETGEVKATVSGQVKEINKDGGYDNFTGMPLPYIVLTQAGEYRVKGSVNELNRDELYAGQSVIIRSRINADHSWTGVITSVETQSEENNNDNFFYGGEDDMFSSSSYPFYVTPDSSEGMLLGQHVFIEPNYGQTTVGSGLWLDASYICVNQTDASYFVWAADKNEEIQMLPVELGEFDASLNRYEILGGLSLTDRIAFPSEDIRVGAPVTEILPQLPVEGESTSEGEEPGETDENGEIDYNEDNGIADMTPEIGDMGDFAIPDDGNELPMDPVGDESGGAASVELPEDIFEPIPGDVGGGA
ncbi:MAG: efflux RND transporter periplasmic adaptor subunit [Oscillospiraceae bacterium]|nr:efflux RND transporter periplasmic adaptor subunit [Oscillospiraceae bacterium]